jgi:hypothetical protein
MKASNFRSILVVLQLLITILSCADTSSSKAEAFVPGFPSRRSFHRNTLQSYSYSISLGRSLHTIIVKAEAEQRQEQEQKLEEDGNKGPPPLLYHGPILPPDAEIFAGISLSELGLDVAIAPSTVMTTGMGLYVRLSDPDIVSATIPSATLLCGYSRLGSFEPGDIGDKTVGFVIRSPQTAVFYERQLMSIVDALEMAARDSSTNGGCGLVGHALQMNEKDTDGEEIQISPVDDGFPRYFVPQRADNGTGSEKENDKEDLSVQNFGQYCNDLAWDYSNPPSSPEEYASRSAAQNVVQLTWRLEYDSELNCLKPSWPVSVLKQDVTFTNQDDFMEIGTQYGWTYWQATVDLEKL